jgi:hypothetical protein
MGAGAMTVMFLFSNGWYPYPKVTKTSLCCRKEAKPEISSNLRAATFPDATIRRLQTRQVQRWRTYSMYEPLSFVTQLKIEATLNAGASRLN